MRPRRGSPMRGGGVMSRVAPVVLLTLVVVLGRGLLMHRGGRGLPAAAVGGTSQGRSAKGHARESRDNQFHNVLVHIAPTFPGFLPLH